jgi:uncharacterized membrane protein YfcA
MNVLEFSLIVGVGGVAAGFLGALTGLGGGVVIIPLLTVGFGVEFHIAAGAALVSVIATSSGAASAYVKEGYSNVRVGMFLEIATTVGALSGRFSAPSSPSTLWPLSSASSSSCRPTCPGLGTRVRRAKARPTRWPCACE